MATQPAEHVEAAVDPPKLIDRFCEYRVQQRWRGRVEQVPNVIVAGDFSDAEQTGAAPNAHALPQVGR